MRHALLLLLFAGILAAADHDAVIARLGTALAASFAKPGDTCVLGAGQLVDAEALQTVQNAIRARIAGTQHELPPEKLAETAKDMQERLQRNHAALLKELRDLLADKEKGGGDPANLARLAYRGATYRIVSEFSAGDADGRITAKLLFALPDGEDRQRLVTLEAGLMRVGDRCILAHLGSIGYVRP